MFNQILDKYHIKEVVENKVGLSNDRVYYLKSDKQNYYLKISSNKEILNEVKAYRFLKGKVSVPKVYEFFNREGNYYLLMSEVKGKMLYELLENDIKQTIIIYAKSLKQLHEVDIHDYDGNRDISTIVSEIKYRLDQIDVNELESQTRQWGIQKTYQRLIELLPSKRDLVFVHGDYCMPNILIENGHPSFIDLGRSGIDDRYNDIAIALRSLKMNIAMIGQPFLPEYNTLFLETYGIKQVDDSKCEFYYLLDEFF